MDKEQDRSALVAGDWNQIERWPAADSSRKDIIVPFYQNGQLSNKKERGRERSLKEPLASLISVGWGFGLLIYATYTLNIQRAIFHLDRWETYQQAVHAVG